MLSAPQRLLSILIAVLLTVTFHHCNAAQDAASLPEELRNRLVQQIDAMKKAGEKPKAWLDVFGEKAERPIDGADAKTLTVLVQGNPFPVSWDKMCGAETLTVARSIAQGNGERLLLAAEIALALNAPEQASDLLTQASQADPALADKIKEFAGRLPAHAAPPAPAPAETAHVTSTPNTGMTASGVLKRSGSARKDRPRVLMDATRLAMVRARASNADGKRFLGWISKGPTDQAPIAWPLAFVMTNDETYSRRAIEMAQKIVDHGPIEKITQYNDMSFVAVVYDWCHEKLPEEKRKAWQTWFLKGFDATKDQYMIGYHNYMMDAMRAFAFAGYALEGDNPRAADLLDNAYNQRWAKHVLPACKAGLAGGAWAEGEGYGTTGCIALLEVCEAARCAEGKDLFSLAPEFFAGRLAFELFEDEPTLRDGGHRLWINGDMHRERQWDDALEQRLFLVDALRGTEIGAFAQAYTESPLAPKSQFNSMNFVDVMWRDRTLPQKPLELFKLSHLAWGRGTVLMRSDWTEHATHVGFVAGPLISASHAHADAGHFTIWKENELCSQAGDYRGTAGPWPLDAYKRTIAHNTLLIYDPAEKFEVRHTPALNDGGQLWNDGEENLQGAKIIAYDARRAYTYVCADLTPAYAKAKAALVRRQFLFIRPGTVIVLDRVISTHPEFEKVWQCYLSGMATVNGKSFASTNGKGKLKAEALLPADASVTLLGGQDKAINVFGKKIAQPPDKSDAGPAWRVEVHPGEKRMADTFLVVLHAYDGAEPASATCKDSGSQITISISGFGDVVLNADGSPGGSVAGKSLAQSLVAQEE